ncbi:CRISPR-associated endonuclease Cas3'' [Streptomyces sp. NPDC059193]|uniref:CRISPR-associated endonuclease Cas3'' n=1 Tax=Streptomyces sp. NPDC059193 TaxID=3346763 RepID=UPI0036C15A98
MAQVDGTYRWVWGKTQDRSRYREAERGWNPLLAHMLDTGATARELWDRYLSDNVRAVLTEAFGGGDSATARAVVPFLAALHDLGKAAPTFLHGFDRHPRTHLRTARAVWEEEARARAVPLPDSWEGLYWAHHQHITAATLPRLLGCDCPVADGQRCRVSEHQGLHSVAYALGGHHGHVPGAETVGTATIARGGSSWDDVRRDLVEVTAALLGVDLSRLAALVAPVKPAALTSLMGLVIMSDWIASNDDRFPYSDLGDTDEKWWQAAQDRASRALTALCLDRWAPTEATWEELWPGTEPRPSQTAVMDLLPAGGPALVLVEGPPTSGKTRTALWCAHALASRNGYQGLYIAMPAKADAGRIADEVKRFMRTAVANENSTLAVVHADALAEQFVNDLIDSAHLAHPVDRRAASLDALEAGIGTTLESDRAERDPALDPTVDEHAGRDRAVLDPWYLRGCVGLMAAFGVGTIDEVMLAAQPSRHWMLRLLALSGKTVVIDDAHAYELYQQELLGITVQWLADAGASVVVLSHSLPAATRAALTASWCAGLQLEVVDAGGDGPVEVVDARGQVSRGGPPTGDTPQSAATLRLRRYDGPVGLATELLHRARHGGCVGVVRNQVDEAVSLYRAAVACAEAHGWDESEILLSHELFQTHQQRSTEGAIRSLLGDGSRARPNRLLVITTQSALQSVDFDHMVCDLAPIDLLVARMGSLHRDTEKTGLRRSWCERPQMDVLFRADPQEPDLPLVEPPRRRPERRAGTHDGSTYAPYVLAATFRTLQSRCDTEGRIELSLPRDVTGLLTSVYESRQSGEGGWGALLDRTWDAWRLELMAQRLAAEENGVRPYIEGHPATVDWLVSGELNGKGEEGGVEGLRALPRLSTPTVSAICLYKPVSKLTYDAAGEREARFYKGDELKKGVPPAVEREVRRRLLLHTVHMPGKWFQGHDRLPEPHTWPKQPFKPIGESAVLVFDASGACVSGLPGRVHYDPRTGLRRL